MFPSTNCVSINMLQFYTNLCCMSCGQEPGYVAKVMAALNQRASDTGLRLRLKPSSMRLVSCCQVWASHIMLLDKEGPYMPRVGIVFKASTTRPDGRDRTLLLWCW